MKKVIKNSFYPHPKNNYKPYFWHPISVTFFAIIIIALSSIVLFKDTDVEDQSLLGDVKSGVVIALTNSQRQNVKLPDLIENQTLNQSAQLKAEDMAQKSYFAHYSPEGFSPWHWFNEAGYSYQKAGENLAVNFDDSKDVVNAWMKSPTHRENIVKDGYSEIGIGIAEGKYKGKNATFVVQHFAKPKDSISSDLALLFEKQSTVNLTTDTSVKGISIETVSLNDLVKGSASNVYLYLTLLALLTLLILTAIFILLKKSTVHTKQFYISIIVLTLVLVIAIATQISFWKDISLVL